MILQRRTKEVRKACLFSKCEIISRLIHYKRDGGALFIELLGNNGKAYTVRKMIVDYCPFDDNLTNTHKYT